MFGRLKLSTPENETKQLIADYNHILNAAKNCDTAALKAYVKHSCIDVRWGEKTPVQSLAIMGYVEAAEYLINNFGASLQEAITGYAIAGNVERVNMLLQRGAFALDAIRGYARAGYNEACEALCFRAEVILEQSTYVECQVAALEGYARGGYSEGVRLILDRIRSISRFDNDVLEKDKKIAVQGHRFTFQTGISNLNYNDMFKSSHFARLYALKMLAFHTALNRGLESTPISNNYAFAAYAMSNKFDYTQHFPTKPRCTIIALAYAGRFAQVEAMISLYGYQNSALFGYAAGGHANHVAHLIQHGAKASFAIVGYARYGHIKHAESLMNFTNGYPYALFTALYMGGYLSNQEILLRTLVSLERNDLRELLLRWIFEPEVTSGIINTIPSIERGAIGALYCFGDTISCREPEPAWLTYSDYLLMRANKISQMMHECDLNYTQVRIWMNPAYRTWVLDGQSLVKTSGMPRDIFNIITAKAFSLPIKDVRDIYEKICIPLYKRLLESSLIAYRHRVISSKADLSIFNMIINDPRRELMSQTYELERLSANHVESFIDDLQKIDTSDKRTLPTLYAAAVYREKNWMRQFAFPVPYEHKEIVERAHRRL